MLTGSQMSIATKLYDLVHHLGIVALRLNQLYDGSSIQGLKVPSIDIFTKNSYKAHTIKDMSIEQLQKVVCLNSFAVTLENGKTPATALYGFMSLFNHAAKSDQLLSAHITEGIMSSKATRDIEAGEELLIDYMGAVQDQEKKRIALAFYGIEE